MLKIYCCDISDFSDEDFLEMYQNADRSRQSKADRLQQEPSKKLTLAAGMLARIGLARYFHVSPKTISFRRGKNGKPYAEGLDIHFSLSHSGSLAVCVISDKPVGIDVEHRRPVNKKVMKRCFTKEERRYVFSEDVRVAGRFLEVWTKKEAYVKMHGMGVADFMSFDVLQQKGVYTMPYRDYVLSVAMQEDDAESNDFVFPKIIQIRSVKDVYINKKRL